MPDATPDPVLDLPSESGPDPTPDLTPDPRPVPAATPTGRDRLLQAMRRPWSRGQAVAGVLLALLGFAAAVQVRANNRDESFVGARQSDLIALINTLASATDRTESEIAELRRTRDSLENDARARSTALEVARGRAETLGILAGTLPAVGPGVRVTVEAPEGSVGTDQLLNGLEELRNAGAEAVEVNDKVRVVAQTGLSDAPGGGVVVDGEVLRPPYVLDVVGDPDTLATALAFEGGFTAEVEQAGGRVRVARRDEVEVTATRRTPKPEFARPADQE